MRKIPSLSFVLGLGPLFFVGLTHANSSHSKASLVEDTQRVEGVFLAAEEDVSLYFLLESGVEKTQFRRRAELVWTDGAGNFTRVFDDATIGRPWSGPFPSAPAAMPVETLSDGSLLLTFPAPPAWENRLGAQKLAGGKRNDRPRVADEQSARLLVVAQFEGVVPQRGNHDATLYGTKVSVDGFVWLRKEEGDAPNASDDPTSSSSWIVWRGARDMRAHNLKQTSFGMGHHFVVAASEACERTIPQGVLLTLPEPARLVAATDPACFPSGKSVSRTTGLQIRGDAATEIRGLLIWK